MSAPFCAAAPVADTRSMTRRDETALCVSEEETVGLVSARPSEVHVTAKYLHRFLGEVICALVLLFVSATGAAVGVVVVATDLGNPNGLSRTAGDFAVACGALSCLDRGSAACSSAPMTTSCAELAGCTSLDRSCQCTANELAVCETARRDMVTAVYSHEAGTATRRLSVVALVGIACVLLVMIIWLEQHRYFAWLASREWKSTLLERCRYRFTSCCQ
jgi:hypothetical protein